MIGSLKKHYSFFVIILVTGLAFFAGYLQNNISSRSDDIKEQINELEQMSLRMDSKIKRNIDFDYQKYSKASDHLFNAIVIALKFYLHYNDFTVVERDLMSLDFVQEMAKRNLLITETYAYLVHTSFESDPSMKEYVVAEKDRDGYDYSISIDDWTKYTPIFEMSQSDFFIKWGLGPVLDDPGVKFLLDQLAGVGFRYIELDMVNAIDMFSAPFWRLMEQKRELTSEAISLEGISKSITAAVSITTVATILASAMTSRLENKESENNFTEIKAKLDGTFNPKLHRDRLSILGLTSALILAVLGILAPMFLRFIV